MRSFEERFKTFLILLLICLGSYLVYKNLELKRSLDMRNGIVEYLSNENYNQELLSRAMWELLQESYAAKEKCEMLGIIH
jgi:hypothetical protein